MAEFLRTGTEYNTELTKEDVPCNIRVGGERDKFVPNINASKWNDECWLNINHPDAISAEKEIFVDGKIELTVGNNIHKYYIDANGHLEYEIILRAKPLTNKIELDLKHADGLEFYYQDSLENEWKIDNNGYETLEEYLKYTHRPDDVVDSYAVYWCKKNNQYKTGKFCHIYRIKAIDANRQEVWCKQQILNKKWTIEIDQAWLDHAVYPVIIDPVLGYDTVGGSNAGGNTTINGSFDDTDGTGGNIDTFHIAIESVDGTSPGVKLGIYNCNQSTGDPDGYTLVEQVEFDVVVSDDNSIAGAGSALAANAKYHIPYLPEHGDNDCKYDTGLAGDHWYRAGVTYANEFVATALNYSSGNRKWSVWVDYSSGGVNVTAEVNQIAIKTIPYSAQVNTDQAIDINRSEVKIIPQTISIQAGANVAINEANVKVVPYGISVRGGATVVIARATIKAVPHAVTVSAIANISVQINQAIVKIVPNVVSISADQGPAINRASIKIVSYPINVNTDSAVSINRIIVKAVPLQVTAIAAGDVTVGINQAIIKSILHAVSVRADHQVSINRSTISAIPNAVSVSLAGNIDVPINRSEIKLVPSGVGVITNTAVAISRIIIRAVPFQAQGVAGLGIHEIVDEISEICLNINGASPIVLNINEDSEITLEIEEESLIP